MSYSNSTPVFGRRNYGLVTAASGTAYLQLFEPLSVSAFTYLEFVQFTTTGTAHVATIMRPLSATTNGSGVPCSCYLTAAVAVSTTTFTVNQNPGTYTGYNFNGTAVPRTANRTVTSGDNVAYMYPDGTWAIDTVASISGLTITMNTGTVSTLGLPVGTPIWYFGPLTAVNPYDAIAHPAFNLYAPSNPTPTNFGSEGYPFIGTFGKGQPLLLSVNNLTNASTMERATAMYSDRGSPYMGWCP
jgi:hypothetical protein